MCIRLRVPPIWAHSSMLLNEWVFGKVVTELKHSIKAYTIFYCQVDEALICWTVEHHFMKCESIMTNYDKIQLVLIFVNSYTTHDGRYMSVGAIEAKFYSSLLEGLGFTEDDLPSQLDAEKWVGKISHCNSISVWTCVCILCARVCVCVCACMCILCACVCVCIRMYLLYIA